jgi:hypothetical protein
MSEGGKRNPWLTHVKQTMKSHKGMKFGQVLKMAKKTYKKGKMSGGGGDVAPAAAADLSGSSPGSTATGGSRRRKGRKGRKGTRRG